MGDNDGWIEWSGGACPVDKSQRVEVRCRNGDGWADQTAGEYYWDHFRDGGDIVAYRVLAGKSEADT